MAKRQILFVRDFAVLIEEGKRTEVSVRISTPIWVAWSLMMWAWRQMCPVDRTRTDDRRHDISPDIQAHAWGHRDPGGALDDVKLSSGRNVAVERELVRRMK